MCTTNGNYVFRKMNKNATDVLDLIVSDCVCSTRAAFVLTIVLVVCFSRSNCEYFVFIDATVQLLIKISFASLFSRRKQKKKKKRKMKLFVCLTNSYLRFLNKFCKGRVINNNATVLYSLNEKQIELNISAKTQNFLPPMNT